MKKLSSIVPVLLCLGACQSNPTTPTTATAPPPAVAAPKQANVEPANREHIETGMVTINGKPHKQLTIRQLRIQLGRPDSIAKGAVECGGDLATMASPEGDFWYYGGTMYEVNGDQAIIASFDVTTGKFRGKLGKVVLNQHTTLEDFRRFYPLSAKQADVPSTSCPGEIMELPFYHRGEQTENTVLFFFKKGLLQKVDFWSPC